MIIRRLDNVRQVGYEAVKSGARQIGLKKLSATLCDFACLNVKSAALIFLTGFGFVCVVVLKKIENWIAQVASKPYINRIP